VSFVTTRYEQAFYGLFDATRVRVAEQIGGQVLVFAKACFCNVRAQWGIVGSGEFCEITPVS